MTDSTPKRNTDFSDTVIMGISYGTTLSTEKEVYTKVYNPWEPLFGVLQAPIRFAKGMDPE